MTPWKRPVAAILGLVVVVDAFMLLTDMGPRPLLVAALGCLLGASIWFVADLSNVAIGSAGVPSELSAPPPVRADRRVTRLRSGLAYGRTDDGSLERLRDSLIDLIDDQLAVAHDTDRRADPDAAAAIMGPELTAFVTDDRAVRSLDKPRNLDNVLTLIERL